MSRGPRRRLRVVVESVIGATIAFAATALVLAVVRPDSGVDRADVPEGSISVEQAVTLGSRTEDIVVTGYVFVGDERAILCSGRDDEDPPYCDGTVVELEGLDTSRLDLVVPDDAPAYSRDEVTLAGTYSLASLQVREILQSAE